MTTRVIFNIDKKVKERAVRRARAQGLALSTVLKMATQSYIDGGLNVQIVKPEIFNEKTQREIDLVRKDIRAGKNLSPRFSNAKDAIAWLKKEVKHHS